MCIKLIDIKVLVAYSSVVHMAMLTPAILRITCLGVRGSLIIIVSHGLVSSGIFAQVNSFYKKTHSRNILLNKGLLIYSSLPVVS